MIRHSKWLLPGLLGLLTAAAAGCYKEQPLQTLPPAPATRLIAQLTDSGTVAMSNAIGAGALSVEGVVSEASSQQWTLQMLRVNHRDGRAIYWKREPVVFPANVLVSPTVRVLDKRRSWLAAGGIVVGAFVVARALDIGFVGEEDEGTEQPPQQIVIPAFGRR
jgi:hypothetical protein